MYWDNGHMDAGWGLVMALGMLAVWALIVVAIVWFIRTGTGRASSTHPAGNAEQILAERLARGEIDAEDYRARLAALRAAH
jgi:putative membrane protein